MDFFNTTVTNNLNKLFLKFLVASERKSNSILDNNNNNKIINLNTYHKYYIIYLFSNIHSKRVRSQAIIIVKIC